MKAFRFLHFSHILFNIFFIEDEVRRILITGLQGVSEIFIKPILFELIFMDY